MTLPTQLKGDRIQADFPCLVQYLKREGYVSADRRKDRSRYTRKPIRIKLSGLSETVELVGRIFPDKQGLYNTDSIDRYTIVSLPIVI